MENADKQVVQYRVTGLCTGAWRSTRKRPQHCNNPHALLIQTKTRRPLLSPRIHSVPGEPGKEKDGRGSDKGKDDRTRKRRRKGLIKEIHENMPA